MRRLGSSRMSAAGSVPRSGSSAASDFEFRRAGSRYASVDVVPANAGTHTPRSLFWAQCRTDSSISIACGYGPLLSQGRRKCQTQLFALSRRSSARVVQNVAPRKQRAQGKPGRSMRTRSLACKKKNTRAKSLHVRRNDPAFPARMVLRFPSCSPW